MEPGGAARRGPVLPHRERTVSAGSGNAARIRSTCPSQEYVAVHVLGRVGAPGGVRRAGRPRCRRPRPGRRPTRRRGPGGPSSPSSIASSNDWLAEATVQVPTAAASKYLRSDLQSLNTPCVRGAMLTSTSAITRCRATKSWNLTNSTRLPNGSRSSWRSRNPTIRRSTSAVPSRSRTREALASGEVTHVGRRTAEVADRGPVVAAQAGRLLGVEEQGGELLLFPVHEVGDDADALERQSAGRGARAAGRSWSSPRSSAAGSPRGGPGRRTRRPTPGRPRGPCRASP